MEKITINKDIQSSLIKDQADQVISNIVNNANNGIEITEVFLPKDIASGIRDEIERQLDESKTNYDFLVVDRRPNEFTGRMGYFTGKTIGNQKYYKIKIS